MRFRPLPLALAAALLLPIGMAPAAGDPSTEAEPPAAGESNVGFRAAGQRVQASVTGEVQRIAIEMRDGTGHVVTVVVPERGTPVRVQDDELTEVETGAVAVVDLGRVSSASQELTEPDGGAAVLDVAVLPPGDEQVAAAPGEDLPDFDGTARPVFIMAARMTGQARDGVRTSHLRTDVDVSVDPYYADSTGGAVRFRVGGGQDGTVYPSWGSLSGCDLDQALDFLDFAAARGGAPVGSGRHTLVYTPTIWSCDFAGIAHVGDGGAAWVNGAWDLNPSQSFRRDLAAHELGHNLTLGHSTSSKNCTESSHDADGFPWECDADEYGDPYDVMGSLGRGPLNGAHLDTMGLLDDESLVTVTSSRSVTLAPVGGLEGLRFATFETEDSTYFVEYRAAVGRDSRLGPETGVLIRRVEWDPALLQASSADPDYSMVPQFALAEGRSFQTADYGARVSVTSVTPTEATIQIDMPGTAPMEITGVTDSTEVESPFETSTYHVTTTRSVTMTWEVDPALALVSQEVWRNGRRMLTVPAGQRDLTVRLVDGWNDMRVRGVTDTGAKVRTAKVGIGFDVEPPFLDFLDLRLRGGSMTAAGVPATLDWYADDDVALDSVTLLNPVRTMEPFQWETWVDQPVGAKTWTLRARDVAGLTTTKAIRRTATVVPETATVRTGGWSTVSSSYLQDGKALRATTQGASMSLTFSGRSVAWIGSKGPGQGTAVVTVDGVRAATIDLEAPATEHKRLLFVKNFWQHGTHTVKVTVSPKALSDGFVVLK